MITRKTDPCAYAVTLAYTSMRVRLQMYVHSRTRSRPRTIMCSHIIMRAQNRAYIHARAYACSRANTDLFIYARNHSHLCVWTHTVTYLRTHTHAVACMHTLSRTCECTRVRTIATPTRQTHTLVHACSRAHTLHADLRIHIRARTLAHSQTSAYSRTHTQTRKRILVHANRARRLEYAHPYTDNCEHTLIHAHLDTLTHKHAHVIRQMRTHTRSGTLMRGRIAYVHTH